MATYKDFFTGANFAVWEEAIGKTLARTETQRQKSINSIYLHSAVFDELNNRFAAYVKTIPGEEWELETFREHLEEIIQAFLFFSSSRRGLTQSCAATTTIPPDLKNINILQRWLLGYQYLPNRFFRELDGVVCAEKVAPYEIVENESDQLIVTVDGKIPQAILLPPGTEVSQSAVVDAINEQIVGATASEFGKRLCVRTDSVRETGSVLVEEASSAFDVLGFDGFQHPNSSPPPSDTPNFNTTSGTLPTGWGVNVISGGVISEPVSFDDVCFGAGFAQLTGSNAEPFVGLIVPSFIQNTSFETDFSGWVNVNPNLFISTVKFRSGAKALAARTVTNETYRMTSARKPIASDCESVEVIGHHQAELNATVLTGGAGLAVYEWLVSDTVGTASTLYPTIELTDASVDFVAEGVTPGTAVSVQDGSFGFNAVVLGVSRNRLFLDRWRPNNTALETEISGNTGTTYTKTTLTDSTKNFVTLGVQAGSNFTTRDKVRITITETQLGQTITKTVIKDIIGFKTITNPNDTIMVENWGTFEPAPNSTYAIFRRPSNLLLYTVITSINELGVLLGDISNISARFLYTIRFYGAINELLFQQSTGLLRPSPGPDYTEFVLNADIPSGTFFTEIEVAITADTTGDKALATVDDIVYRCREIPEQSAEFHVAVGNVMQKVFFNNAVRRAFGHITYSGVMPEDGDYVSIGTQTYEFDHGAHASGVLAYTGNPADGNLFTIDGETFEFDTIGGDLNNSGNTRVTIFATPDETFSDLTSKVNDVVGTLILARHNPTTNRVRFVTTTAGIAGNATPFDYTGVNVFLNPNSNFLSGGSGVFFVRSGHISVPIPVEQNASIDDAFSVLAALVNTTSDTTTGDINTVLNRVIIEAKDVGPIGNLIAFSGFSTVNSYQFTGSGTLISGVAQHAIGVIDYTGQPAVGNTITVNNTASRFAYGDTILFDSGTSEFVIPLGEIGILDYAGQPNVGDRLRVGSIKILIEPFDEVGFIGFDFFESEYLVPLGSTADITFQRIFDLITGGVTIEGTFDTASNRIVFRSVAAAGSTVLFTTTSAVITLPGSSGTFFSDPDTTFQTYFDHITAQEINFMTGTFDADINRILLTALVSGSAGNLLVLTKVGTNITLSGSNGTFFGGVTSIFADPNALTCDDVIGQINEQTTGLTAVCNALGQVQLISSVSGVASAIVVGNGTANEILGFINATGKANDRTTVRPGWKLRVTSDVTTVADVQVFSRTVQSASKFFGTEWRGTIWATCDNPSAQAYLSIIFNPGPSFTSSGISLSLLPTRLEVSGSDQGRFEDIEFRLTVSGLTGNNKIVLCDPFLINHIDQSLHLNSSTVPRNKQREYKLFRMRVANNGLSANERGLVGLVDVTTGESVGLDQSGAFFELDNTAVFPFSDTIRLGGVAAQGNVSYFAQPLDGDLLVVGSDTYEFDSNLSTTPGNNRVAIGSTLDQTYSGLSFVVNSVSASVSSTHEPTKNTVNFVAKIAGTASNDIVFVSTSDLRLFTLNPLSGKLAGGSAGGQEFSRTTDYNIRYDTGQVQRLGDSTIPTQSPADLVADYAFFPGGVNFNDSYTQSVKPIGMKVEPALTGNFFTHGLASDLDNGAAINLDVVPRRPDRFSHLVPATRSRRVEVLDNFTISGVFAVVPLSVQANAVCAVENLLVQDGVSIPLITSGVTDGWQFTDDENHVAISTSLFDSTAVHEFDYAVKFQFTTSGIFVPDPDIAWILLPSSFRAVQLDETKGDMDRVLILDETRRARLQVPAIMDQTLATLTRTDGGIQEELSDTVWQFVDENTIEVFLDGFSESALYRLVYKASITQVRDLPVEAWEYATSENGTTFSSFLSFVPGDTKILDQFVKFRVTITGDFDVDDYRLRSFNGLADTAELVECGFGLEDFGKLPFDLCGFLGIEASNPQLATVLTGALALAGTLAIVEVGESIGMVVIPDIPIAK